MQYWRGIWVVCLAGGGIWLTHAAAQSDAARNPLQVRLESPLDTRRTTAGTPVVTSALAPWKTPSCSLKVGSTVTGHVVEAQSMKNNQHGGSMAVAFDKADCNGHHDLPLRLSLVALVRDEESEAERDAKNNPGMVRSDDPVSSGAVGSRAPGGHGAYVGAGVLIEPTRKQGSGPASIEAGQVVGVRRLELDVGAGAMGASVLRSAGHDFNLDTRVELILRLREDAPSPPAERAEGDPPAAPAPPSPSLSPVPRPDSTEVCSAAECNIADRTGGSGAGEGARLAMPLLRFGYSPRTEMRWGFDQGTTVNYLSAQQLLITFDTHRLRTRFPGVWPDAEQRPIRAVLANARTGEVERVLDWIVDGEGPYLWPAGPGRVAVHMGGALQMFGPDLKPEIRIPVDAPLLWVASAPLGDPIAFALVRERHTREVHAFLRERTGNEPEEDIEVRLVDREGIVRLVRSATSGMRPPVLTESGGEIGLRRQAGDRWLLREDKGAAGGRARTIAAVNSTCEPTLSMPLPDTLFVTGCDASARWYRVLHGSGRTMLLGRNSAVEIEQDAVGSGGDLYAVRVVRTRVAVTRGTYEVKDLADERVGVYRTRDNKRVLLATTESFPETRHNFALSPDGHQLALLTRSEVRFYTITDEGLRREGMP